MRRTAKTRYIPLESIAVNHPDGLGVAYVRRFGASYQVIAYGGKRNNADFNYAYKTIEAVHTKIEEWFAGLSAHLDFVNKRRSELFQPHTFKVGDIITNSWGYDQTNVDFYRVVKTSDHFVWLKEIAGHCEESGFMSGHSVPHVDTGSDDPAKWGFRDVEKAEVTQHKAYGNHVCMKYGSGSKWDGRAMYTSWYA